MIGTETEKQILNKLKNLFEEDGKENINDWFIIEHWKHEILQGCFISNGVLYYGTFRETNNNLLCHSMPSSNEIVFYLYDNKYNRGHKFFIKHTLETSDTVDCLYYQNRDGIVGEMTNEILKTYYEECVPVSCVQFFDATCTDNIVDFMRAAAENGVYIDSFKNKIYLSYGQVVCSFLEKIDLFNCNYSPFWNTPILNGDVSRGISSRLRYEKPKKEVKNQIAHNRKLVTQSANQLSTNLSLQPTKKNKSRRIVVANSNNKKLATNATISDDIMGSKEHKNTLMKITKGDKSVSFFTQAQSNFHNLKYMQMAIQKLKTQHVHSASAKNIADDCLGYICTQCLGNIGSAGRNMFFDESVEISFGHPDLILPDILKFLNRLANAATTSNGNLSSSQPLMTSSPWERTIYYTNNNQFDQVVIVINNLITKFRTTKQLIEQRSLLDEFIFSIKRVYKYAEVLHYPYKSRNFLCINIIPGLPFRPFSFYNDISAETAVMFSRKEIEFYVKTINNCIKTVDQVNTFICHSLQRSNNNKTLIYSNIAREVDQHTLFTLPTKRTVAVNCFKSSIPPVKYRQFFNLVKRQFQMFSNVESFERAELDKEKLQLNKFNYMKSLQENYSPSTTNFYYLRTIFGDFKGLNVEDAYVLNSNVDLCLDIVFFYSINFTANDNKIRINLPNKRLSVNVITRDEITHKPTCVLFQVAIVGFENEDDIEFPPYKRLNVYKNENCYIFYFRRSDQMLLDKIHNFETSPFYKPGIGYESIFKLLEFNVYKYKDYKEEVEHYPQQQISSSSYLGSRTQQEEEVGGTMIKNFVKPNNSYVNDSQTSSNNTRKRLSHYRIEANVIFETPHFDGIKLGTSAGQKGLAIIRKDVDQTFDTKKSVQLVVNNCSLVSRCAVGQLLQMNRNLPTLIKCKDDDTNNIGICGYVPVFVMSNYITPSTAPMRLDQMHKCALIANSLPRCVNTKCCDNVANFEQLALSTDSRHIIDLYKCIYGWFRFNGDSVQPYTTREDVEFLTKLYQIWLTTKQKIMSCNKNQRRRTFKRLKYKTC
jgi:hypothetical protein